MLYILLCLLVLIILTVILARSFKKHQKIQDSLLKRRAIFSTHQQLIFKRLTKLLPNYLILAHVSYDVLLTTKFVHTRDKYKSMIADFVILDEHYNIVVIVNFDHISTLKRKRDIAYEEAILKSVGYKLLHYSRLPDLQELRLALRQYISEEKYLVTRNLGLLNYFPYVKQISQNY
jgi:hypothetical protein